MRMDAVALPGVPRRRPQRGRGLRRRRRRAAAAGGGRRIPTFGGAVPADPGEYTVVITAGGKTLSKTAVILEDVWFDKMF